MTTIAVIGYGTLLKKGDGASPEVFTTVAAVTSIGGPNLQADDIEVTDMESPSGYKEYISGLKDGGTVDFEINFNPTNSTHTGLFDDQVAGTSRNWKIVFPSSVSNMTFSFAGTVKTFNLNTDPNTQLSASISIKVSGAPTLA